MTEPTPDYRFERRRGVVWVCDLANSAEVLNGRASVEAFEVFLPRLYWISNEIVRLAGGEVVKWTGDGFLAWLPLALDRDKGHVGRTVYSLAWHLTVLVNVTQLGLQPVKRFQLRHAVTVERDGYFMDRILPSRHDRDVIGRDVVLAFRLASIPSEFPHIVTQQDLASAAGVPSSIANFERWTPSQEDALRYFKGERYGIDLLARSAKPSSRSRSLPELLEEGEELLRDTGGPPTAIAESAHVFANALVTMKEGPDWAGPVAAEYLHYMTHDLRGTLERVVDLLKTAEPREGSRDTLQNALELIESLDLPHTEDAF